MWARSQGQTRRHPIWISVITSGTFGCWILTLADVPDTAEPPPDLAGARFYIFFIFRSRALLGHFGGAMWHLLIGPHGIH
jgi:hypothetical protein